MTDEQKRLQALLSDQLWRLNNLYSILDINGKKIKFKLNWAQNNLYHNMHYFNVILKARQLGFSTFTMIYILDACLFNTNHSAGVIAHTREDAEDLFKNKVKFAYDNLPDWIKKGITATTDSARKIEFSNGSSITVGTSLRGGTYQKLHVSEYGKISARYPEKAKEIKTGALNTIHAGQQIFIESTAEGNAGEFYNLCMRAIKLRQQGVELTTLDPKLHFYPWCMHPSYNIDAEVSIDQKMSDYFKSLPIELKPAQKAWYVKKQEQMGEDMKQEFPTTPKEAFEQSMEGAIYSRQMAMVRTNGQICHLPYVPNKPVSTWWDLGKGGSDYTAIWFMQEVNGKIHFIDYHQGHNEGWQDYLTLLNSKGYAYGEHVLPWDGNMAIAGTKKITSAKECLYDLGIRPIRLVPQTKSVWEDIKGPCKNILPQCFFDERNCKEGIVCLDTYRREWDEKIGWKDKPHHGENSHGADSFRTFAMGYRGNTHQTLVGFGDSMMDEPQQFAETSNDLL